MTKRTSAKKDLSDILKYVRVRVQTLKNIIDYYEKLERDQGFMKTDDQISFQIACSQMNELERLVDFIEGIQLAHANVPDSQNKEESKNGII